MSHKFHELEERVLLEEDLKGSGELSLASPGRPLFLKRLAELQICWSAAPP